MPSLLRRIRAGLRDRAPVPAGEKPTPRKLRVHHRSPLVHTAAPGPDETAKDRRQNRNARKRERSRRHV